jgi:hypothetical protein
MTKPAEIKRGIYIYINADGSVNHEILGALGEIEVLGITKYLELLPSEISFSNLAQNNERNLAISTAIADAIKAIAETIEGEPSCGTESSEDSLPSQD